MQALRALIFWAVLFGIVGFGFLLGSYFAFHILVLASIASVAILIWMSATFEELESLITLGFGIGATIANVAMWVTYYIATNQTWVGEFFLRNILR